MQIKLSAIIPAVLVLVSATSSTFASKHTSPLKRAHRNLARLNSHELEKRGGSGAPGTYYNIRMGEVACGGYYQPNDFIVAMNSPDFAGGSACGKTITINYHGKSVQAIVRDECPTCGPHGIDMTEGLFTTFASTYVGEIYLDWNWGGSPPPPAHTQPPPPATTTHHTTTKTTSTSTHHSTSTSTSTSSSSSAAPSATPVVPSGANNIAALFQAVVGLGELVIAGASN